MLTREQILTMNAGPILDTHVAELVMRWQPHERNTIHWTDARDADAVGGYPIRAIVGDWRPSKDIGAAWEVFRFESLRVFSKRRRFLAELEQLLQTSHGGAWKAAWPDAILFLSPDLICRAALLATLQEGRDA